MVFFRFLFRVADESLIETFNKFSNKLENNK